MGKEWDSLEETILSKLFHAGESDEKIGWVLERSTASVRIKRNAMGLGRNESAPWTEADVQILRSFVNSGCNDAEIADEMGRTKGAIAAKRSKLGLQKGTPQILVGAPPLKYSAEYVLKRPPLRVDCLDETSRKIANVAFLVSMFHAGHQPRDGERKEGDKPHPYAEIAAGEQKFSQTPFIPFSFIGSPLANCVG